MTEFKFFSIMSDRLNVSPDDVLDTIREKDRTRNNHIFCEVEDIFACLPELCRIRGGYAVFEPVEISVREGIIGMGATALSPGRKICGYMRNVSAVAVFICSAGERFTTVSQQYNSEGDYLKSYLTDVFGSVIAEKTADYIQNALETEMMRKGLKITNRYSPGYCNWHLSEQRTLFDLLPSNECGISLTDSMLMQPIKSVSGIIGIGSEAVKREYACAVCEDRNCPYRKY